MRTAATILLGVLLAAQQAPSTTTPPAHGGPASHLPSLARLQAIEAASYRVYGRIRLLVAWVGRRDVGEARVAWLGREKDDGHGYELLVGTDPQRAPFKMNKWGYVLEESAGAEWRLLGLMTEADAESAGDAKKQIEKASDNQPVKRISGTYTQSAAESEVSIVIANPPRTYREIAAVAGAEPTLKRPPKQLALQPGTRPGMMATVAELLGADAAARRAGNLGRRPNGRPRMRYVYNGTLYDLALDDSRYQPDVRYHGVPYGNVVEADFRVDNKTTGEKTEFTICYAPAARGPNTVPVRIVYRPKWWLELELLGQARR